MSFSEREELARTLESLGGSARKWKAAAANALVLWAVLMLVFVAVWALLARLFQSFAFEFDRPVAVWIAGAGSIVCAVLAVVSSYRWITSQPDRRADLIKDLGEGLVVEESYRFVDAKCFQEPEHGGLIYFLHADDGRVLVLYDHESQDLGVRGEDPFGSRFLPHKRLCMARAPATRFVLSKTFDGDAMNRKEPVELSASPDEWPEQDEFCQTPWDDLEERFGDARLTPVAPS